MGHGTPVADLVADPDRPADVRETLTVHVEDDRYTVNGTSPGPTARGHRRRPGRGDPGQRQRRRRHHPALARRRRARTPPDGVAGVTQDAVLPGRGVRLPLRGRPGRHLLVPLAPGLPRAGAPAACSAPWWSTRGGPDPEVQRRASPSCTGTPTGRRSTARRARPTVDAEPGDAGPAPGRQHRQRPGAAVGDRGAVPGARRRRHGRQRARRGRRREVRPAGRRPRRPRLHGARRAASGSTSAAPPRSCSATTPPAATQPQAPSEFVDLLSYGEPADLGFDPERAGPALRLPDRQAARLPRRPARAVVDASTATCSPTSRCTWSARATSSSSRSTTAATTPTRCTCTGTTRSCCPATASRPPAARGGSTRWRSATARPTRSRSSPTTPASGWTTATTCRTRPRGWSRT